MIKNFSGQILLSDKRKLKDPIKAIKNLPSGSIFIYRDAIVTAKTHEIRKLCKERAIYFFVKEKHMAYKLKADGIHLKEKNRFRPVKDLSSRFYISTSCHSVTSAKLAEKSGKDFIFMSPIFETTSHKNVKPLGRLRFSLAIKSLKIPVIALGGINNKNLPLLNNLKISGFAAIDFFRNQDR